MLSHRSRNSIIYQMKLIMRSPNEYFDTSKGSSMSVLPSVGAWNWNWNHIVMQIGQMDKIGSRSQHTLSFWQEERCPGDQRNNRQPYRQAQKPSIWSSWRLRRNQFGY